MQLNPHVLDEAKSSLDTTGFCRVADAFPRDQAKSLTEELKQTTYGIAFTHKGKSEERTVEQIRQMPTSSRAPRKELVSCTGVISSTSRVRRR
jgi:hypothetical protein